MFLKYCFLQIVVTKVLLRLKRQQTTIWESVRQERHRQIVQYDTVSYWWVSVSVTSLLFIINVHGAYKQLTR